MKRFLSIFIVLSLVFVLAVPSFAVPDALSGDDAILPDDIYYCRSLRPSERTVLFNDYPVQVSQGDPVSLSNLSDYQGVSFFSRFNASPTTGLQSAADYTIVLTFSTSVITSFNKIGDTFAFYLPGATLPFPSSQGSILGGVPKLTSTTTTKTVSVSGFAASEVSGWIGIDIPVGALIPAQGEVFLVNYYFGLTSDFDEIAYGSEVLDKLDSMSQKLDNLGNRIDSGLDDLGNKVDDAADSIINKLEQDNQEIKSSSNKADQAVGALDDSGLIPTIDSNFWGGLTTIFSTISDESTINTLSIPAVKVPMLSGSGLSGSITIIPAQDLDFSQILQNEHIQRLISFAKVFYYLFFMVFLVDYARKLIAKITLRDQSTSDNSNDSAPPKDPHASRSDPHGVKMR